MTNTAGMYIQLPLTQIFFFLVYILIFRLKSFCKPQSCFWTICFWIPHGHFQLFSQHTCSVQLSLKSSGEGSWWLNVKDLLVPSPGRSRNCFLIQEKSVVVSYMRQRQLTLLYAPRLREFTEQSQMLHLPGHCHTKAFQNFKQQVVGRKYFIYLYVLCIRNYIICLDWDMFVPLSRDISYFSQMILNYGSI